MRIVIISDIHDNVTCLEKSLEWCEKNKIDIIICCGDITNEDTIKYLSENFKNKIYLIRGNADIYDEDCLLAYENINYLGRYGYVDIENIKIGICHEPYFFNKVLEKNVHIVFFGHTHKPWIEEKQDVKFINPGTLGGVFLKGTFTFWDTKNQKLELISIEKFFIKN